MSDQETQTGKPIPRPRRRRLLIAGVAVVLLASAGVVVRAAEHRGRDGWGMQGGIPLGMIEHRADRMLNRVDATPDQKAKVHAIIEAAARDLEPLRATMGEARGQFASLLTAPQVDRSAMERLRTDRVASMDQATQRISAAVADIADVLTPEQRLKLKQAIDDRRQNDRK